MQTKVLAKYDRLSGRIHARPDAAISHSKSGVKDHNLLTDVLAGFPSSSPDLLITREEKFASTEKLPPAGRGRLSLTELDF